MKKRLTVGVLALSFCGYGLAGTNIKNDIIGIWAMTPLETGRANVVEFKENNVTYLYPFTCLRNGKKVISGTYYNGVTYDNEMERSTYSISNDVISITFNGEKKPYILLRFKGVEKQRGKTILKLSEVYGPIIGSTKTEFSYTKTDKIQPLCAQFFDN
ncbi:hypothetical protein [Xenorhabdus szentirmaii]|uniref:Lipocalin-like domain-containing protein n=2 Tax=Xenorhabdus szentirmaii TaxID=290112 RepID=W1J2A9_9GAMM|nr:MULTISPECIES: hypothetical protein [Xenorhabdus]MBD2782130.1 hypothetical protein [Xenorhabdus sp. 38]MBD2802043.1 hypothetical protein [Xenorhabdus sp. M]MBD2806663.1 hypothetical protein [Xenorhabdus sp. ZM]MBD2826840.1 hypothetical protein [Xenorhabdus sp. 5]PHM31631.1 hypothetical protein Xsze_02343 [Xenorhabdus szentirmaii DSM 16338]